MEAEWSHPRHNSQWGDKLTVPRLLSIAADVRIDVDGQELKVIGDGSRIEIHVPSARVAFRILRGLGPFGLTRNRVARLSKSLTAVGLTAVVKTPERRLLSIGSEVNSRVTRLLGVPNAKLHLR